MVHQRGRKISRFMMILEADRGGKKPDNQLTFSVFPSPVITFNSLRNIRRNFV
jgi:hypothetical protein